MFRSCTVSLRNQLTYRVVPLTSVAPVANQVVLEPGIGQLGEF